MHWTYGIIFNMTENVAVAFVLVVILKIADTQ